MQEDRSGISTILVIAIIVLVVVAAGTAHVVLSSNDDKKDNGGDGNGDGNGGGNGNGNGGGGGIGNFKVGTMLKYDFTMMGMTATCTVKITGETTDTYTIEAKVSMQGFDDQVDIEVVPKNLMGGISGVTEGAVKVGTVKMVTCDSPNVPKLLDKYEYVDIDDDEGTYTGTAYIGPQNGLVYQMEWKVPFGDDYLEYSMKLKEYDLQ